MNLTFKGNYWDDPASKSEFIGFLIKLFGLDLSRWDQHGYWDNKYRPFSFFDGDRIVSNLCVYSMDMSVMGKRCRVAQISAVGTLPEYRRQGLSSELTRMAMDWARPNHDFFYLFADKDAYPFYKRVGFRLVHEHTPCCSIKGKAPLPGAIKLNIQQPDHLDLIYRIAVNRDPVSDILGVHNEKLFMFWCLYFLAENIYYIEALHTLILYKRNQGIMTVFDIVGQKIPPFSEIYPYISDPDDKKVEFRFMVDKMNLGQYQEIPLIEENGTHLCGDFPLGNRDFILPATCQA